MNLTIRALTISICCAIFSHQAFAEPKRGKDFEVDVVPDADVWEAVVREMGGIRPQVARQLEEAAKDYDRASQFRPQVSSISKSYPVSLVVGNTPNTVFVTPYKETHVVFLDANGKPWPILEASCGDCPPSGQGGNSGAEYFYNVTISEKKAHIMRLETISDVGRTNVGVTFDGIDVPVKINLVSSVEQYHDEARFVLPMSNPAIAASHESTQFRRTSAISAPALRAAMDGIASTLKGVTPLSVTATTIAGTSIAAFEARAWLHEGQLLLVTEGIAPAPSPQIEIPGVHQINGYQYRNLESVISVQDNRAGRRIFLKIDYPTNQLGYRYEQR